MDGPKESHVPKDNHKKPDLSLGRGRLKGCGGWDAKKVRVRPTLQCTVVSNDTIKLLPALRQVSRIGVTKVERGYGH